MHLIIKRTAIGASATIALMMVPTGAKAECTRGANIIVNRGHGASITFDEPVFQAQVFDVSKLILEPIPEQGTRTLILTEVEAQTFPGLPQTTTTSLLASTANGCFVFDVSFGEQPIHHTISAERQTSSELLASSQLSQREALDIEALRNGYNEALEQHGTENTFLQRVERFLTLVDEGTSQQVAAQQAGVNWAHLMQLSGQQPVFEHLLDGTFST